MIDNMEQGDRDRRNGGDRKSETESRGEDHRQRQREWFSLD